MKLRFVSLGLAVATVLGCGGKSGQTSSGNGPEVDSFCRSLVSSLVARAASCYQDSQRNWKELFETLWNCNELKAAIGAGRIAYDPAAGAVCLLKEQTARCAGLVGAELSQECQAALVGQVGTDEPCHNWGFAQFECGASNQCQQDDLSCHRTCQPQPGPPSYAPATPSWAGETQPCDDLGSVHCEGGLYCAGDDGLHGETGTCRKQRTGGSCRDGYECGWGYSCRSGAGQKDGVTTCVRDKTAGQSCTPGEHECISGYSCAGNGKCVPVEYLKQGGICVDLPEVLLCEFGLYCDYTLGTCQPRKPKGAPCEPGYSNSGCSGEGSYCDEASKTCVDCS